ncbi:MAG: glycosyltransferase 87 family protein [Mycobacterium sp.]
MGVLSTTGARRAAPAVLLVSAIVSGIGHASVGPHFLDLHTIVIAPMGLTNGHLYDSHASAMSAHGAVGHRVFVYPPFAAVLLYPWHWFPMWLVETLWFVAEVAATYGVVRLTQKLLRNGDAGSALLWTAAALWFDPISNAISLGQVGIFLTFAVLYGAYVKSDAVAGILVGIATGIKLTPGVTWLYLAGQRRFAALATSIAVFAATIGFAFVAFPDAAFRYFKTLFGDATVMPYAQAINQSWLGALTRIAGHHVGGSALHAGVLIGTGVLAVFAWHAVDDTLGRLLVVQIFGLLVSPISWTHHWVWLLPLVMWLLRGPVRRRGAAPYLGWGWIVLMVLNIPNGLEMLQANMYQVSRPWYQAWAGAIYVVAAVGTLGWIAVSGRPLTPFRSRDVAAEPVRPPVDVTQP